MNAAFTPAWWCRNPHLQSIWPYLFRRKPRPPLRRERLELPDGDFLDLDWTTGSGGPLVVVLHGLEGNSKSHYIRGILQAVGDKGWRGVVMHFRGCSGEPNRLPRAYHSGETGDLSYTLHILREREPDTPMAMVGYSLGGNALLKWLGESRQTACLRAAAAVSVPFELAKGARRMEKGLSRIYQYWLVSKLKQTVRQKQRQRGIPFDLKALRKVRTFFEFDDLVTAPLHGFANAADYYARSSSRQFLANITTPTLIVHALDDPFMTPDTAPTAADISPSVTLLLSRHGGHVGFVAGARPWKPRYWAEQNVVSFLAEHLCMPQDT